MSSDPKVEDWFPARLMPTAGIRGQEEQETRATSALLAVIRAVPDFGHGLLKDMKAPKGEISTFTEVRLRDKDGAAQIPDGAIIVERGQTRWSCLVEVKTGRARLDGSQTARYLTAARENDFDGLLTISNEIRTNTKSLPYTVDKRKLKSLTVRHFSWWRILTEAIVHHRFRGIEDPDQAWILGELIRYLDDEKSGATGFEGMGEEWVSVREGARQGTLRGANPEAKAVAARWEQFMEYLRLTLSQELGVEIRRQGGRSKNAQKRVDAAANRLADESTLEGGFTVPDAAGPLTIEATLAAGQVSAAVEIEAPRDLKRPRARVNWLLRQLKEARDDLRIDTQFVQTGTVTTQVLRDCRDDPDSLLLADDPKREPRSFTLVRSRAMGRKSGRGAGSFVAEVRGQVTDFYRDLVQDLRPPPTTAPKLPKEDEEVAVEQKAPPETSEGEARREQKASLGNIAQLVEITPPDHR